MYIVNDVIPLGCVYEGENGKTKYCPMLNHVDVPYCQYLEDDEAAIGIDERPVYCPIVEFPYADVPDTSVGDMISRQAAIDALGERPLNWDDNEFDMGLVVQFDADRRMLEAVPSVDAVKVVRCGECKCQDKGENESESWNVCNYRPWLYFSINDDDYCSNGERK